MQCNTHKPACDSLKIHSSPDEAKHFCLSVKHGKAHLSMNLARTPKGDSGWVAISDLQRVV